MNDQAQIIVDGLSPYLVLILGGVMALWLKEVVAGIVAGLRFYIDPAFQPGDQVFLDGEKATIVSIGYKTTIFQIDNGRGTVWRYIPNVKIVNLRLERIIKLPSDNDKH